MKEFRELFEGKFMYENKLKETKQKEFIEKRNIIENLSNENNIVVLSLSAIEGPPPHKVKKQMIQALEDNNVSYVSRSGKDDLKLLHYEGSEICFKAPNEQLSAFDNVKSLLKGGGKQYGAVLSNLKEKATSITNIQEYPIHNRRFGWG